MTESERAAIKERIAQWERAAPVLQAVRDADIRAADTAQSLRIFTGSAAWAAVHRPAEPVSGLVEQQRWFKKLYRHE